jgi:hypothetical protein
MRILSLVLLCKAAVVLLIMAYAGIGLGPDEAQYWTWSRHLDLGYYSKPPGIAWEVAWGTAILGATEVGVRLGALWIGTLFSFAVYYLAKCAKAPDQDCLFAALLAAFTPLGIFSTFLAITDGGMLLFWTLALSVFIKAYSEQKEPAYGLIGLLIALGALFKWPIYLLWLVLAPIGIKSRKFFLGIAVSLLGLLPTLYWNAYHGFATFKHVSTIVQGGHEGAAGANPLAFIGAQAAILSPLVFILLVIAWTALFKKRSSEFFLGASSLAILAAFIMYAFFKKGQGNWCLFAYPAAFVYLATVWKRKIWLSFSLGVSVVLSGFVLAIPTIQSQSLAHGLPWKMNPFRHNVGWAAFKKIPFDPNKQFLMADKYQIVSELSFYNSLQADAYFFNILGTRKNQFSYWAGIEKQKGKDGLFVVVETAPDLDQKLLAHTSFYQEALSPYFETLAAPEPIPLFSAYGHVVKKALIFHGKNYLGTAPKDPEKY